MAIAGFNSLVSVATGVSATYVPVDGIKQFSVGDSTDMFDITDYVDSNLRRRLAGLRDVNISLSGELETTNSGWVALKASYDAGAIVYVMVMSSATNGYTYAMLSDSFEVSAGVDKTVEVKCDLKHEGTVTPIKFGNGF
jgi:predicted secreted protein